MMSSESQSLSTANVGPAQEQPKDRRRAPRQTFVAKASLSPAGFPAMARAVHTRDISMLGMRFVARTPMNVGDSFLVKLEAGPLKWRSRVRVVTCTPVSYSEFAVGAEFVGNELDLPSRIAA